MSKNNIIKLSDDVCYIVFEILDFYDVLNLRISCKRFNVLKIREIVNISQYDSEINETILKKFQGIAALRLFKRLFIKFKKSVDV